MSYDDGDYWDDCWDQARCEIIEQGVRDMRDERIVSYLGSYGDAVQERIERCMAEGRILLRSGFPSQTVVSAVTATELILRYFILRPILEGAFLSDEWASILVRRIFTQRAANDRELLPAVLRAWDIDPDSIKLSSGTPLWGKFISEVVPLRNDIVHRGANATVQQGREALACPVALLQSVVRPLSDRFGFSWSETRCWNKVQQGVGGAQYATSFEPISPFEDK